MRALTPVVRRLVPSVLLIIPIACEDSTVPVEPAVYATPASIVLEVGEQQTLPVTRVPSGAEFVAQSELPAVATVVRNSSTITITGVCEGFISVILTLPAYPGVQSDVVVEVTDATNDDQEPVPCD